MCCIGLSHAPQNPPLAVPLISPFISPLASSVRHDGDHKDIFVFASKVRDASNDDDYDGWDVFDIAAFSRRRHQSTIAPVCLVTTVLSFSAAAVIFAFLLLAFCDRSDGAAVRVCGRSSSVRRVDMSSLENGRPMDYLYMSVEGWAMTIDGLVDTYIDQKWTRSISIPRRLSKTLSPEFTKAFSVFYNNPYHT